MEKMKRISGILILATLIVVMLLVGLFAVDAFAAEDTKAPVLKSVKVLNSTVKAGSDIEVKVTIDERGTGLKEAMVQFNHSTKEYSPTIYYTKTWSKPVYSTKSKLITYTFKIPTEKYNHSGDWFLAYIEFYDSKGNFARYYGNKKNNTLLSEFTSPAQKVSGVTHVNLYGTTGDNRPPVVNWVKIEEGFVEKPGKATVKVNITEESGLEYVQVNLFSVKGNREITKNDFTIETKKGTHTYFFEVPINKNALVGEWGLKDLYLKDKKGNEAHYTSEQGDGYFINYYDSKEKVLLPKFRVTGVDGDTNSPNVVDVKVLNAEKSLQKPGVLKVQLDLEEFESGVTNIEFEVQCTDGEEIDVTNRYMYSFSAKGYEYTQSTGVTNKFFDEPLMTGIYTFNLPFPSKLKNGNYIVYVRTIKDRAENEEWTIWTEAVQDTFVVSDEFDYDFEVGITNTELFHLASKMEEGKVGRVYLNEDGKQNVLPKQALLAIAGKDKKLVCYKGGYQWIFDGLDIDKNKVKDINLTTKIYTVAKDNLSSGQKAICLSFVNHGELPGKVQFRFKSTFVKGFEDNPEDLYLYHVDEAKDDGGDDIDYLNDSYDRVPAKEANFEVIEDDTDNWCYIDLTHNSKYLVSASKINKITMKYAKVCKMKNSFTYNGKAKKQSVTVKLAGKTLKLNKDYKISYKNNKKVGKASFTITGINKYKKFGKKTCYYNINPKSTSVAKLKKGNNKFTVKWKKQSTQTTGYQIKYSTSSKMKSAKTVTVKGAKKTTKTIKKLKNKKTYYVQVRTYKSVDGKRYYSKWSKAKKVKTT